MPDQGGGGSASAGGGGFLHDNDDDVTPQGCPNFVTLGLKTQTHVRVVCSVQGTHLWIRPQRTRFTLCAALPGLSHMLAEMLVRNLKSRKTSRNSIAHAKRHKEESAG